MRALIPVLRSSAGPQLSAQSDQAPVFRSGVEVMEVDVTVVDGQGMPIRDLRAPEFTVTIDGQPRRVVSAEFVADSTASSHPSRGRARSVRVEQHRPAPRPPHHAGRSIATTSTRTRARQSLAPLKDFVNEPRRRTIAWRSSRFRRLGHLWTSRPTTRRCSRP